MPKAYLKCRYYENPPRTTSPHEYLVTFKCSDRHNPKVLLGSEVFPPAGEEWCMVNREDVVPVEENKGLVRLVSLKKCDDKKHAVAWIKDSAEMRLSPYRVLLKEVEIK